MSDEAACKTCSRELDSDSSCQPEYASAAYDTWRAAHGIGIISEPYDNSSRPVTARKDTETWETAFGAFEQAARWGVQPKRFYLCPVPYKKTKRNGWQMIAKADALEYFRKWRNYVFNTWLVFQAARDDVRVGLTGYGSRAKFPIANNQLLLQLRKPVASVTSPAWTPLPEKGKVKPNKPKQLTQAQRLIKYSTDYEQLKEKLDLQRHPYNIYSLAVLMGSRLRWDIPAYWLKQWWKAEMQPHEKWILYLMPYAAAPEARLLADHELSPSEIDNPAAQIYRTAFTEWIRVGRQWGQAKRSLIDTDEHPQRFIRMIGDKRFEWWGMFRLRLDMDENGQLKREKLSGVKAAKRGIRYFQYYVPVSPEDTAAREAFVNRLQSLTVKDGKSWKPVPYEAIERMAGKQQLRARDHQLQTSNTTYTCEECGSPKIEPTTGGLRVCESCGLVAMHRRESISSPTVTTRRRSISTAAVPAKDYRYAMMAWKDANGKHRQAAVPAYHEARFPDQTEVQLEWMQDGEKAAYYDKLRREGKEIAETKRRSLHRNIEKEMKQMGNEWDDYFADRD